MELLLHEDKHLSKGNIEALHRAHEAMTLWSVQGALLAGVRPIFEEIGLPDGNYYMIINNRCTTVDKLRVEIIGKEVEPGICTACMWTEDTDVQLTLFDIGSLPSSRTWRAQWTCDG